MFLFCCSIQKTKPTLDLEGNDLCNAKNSVYHIENKSSDNLLQYR